MEKALARLVIAYIWWQLCLGMEHDDKLRNKVVEHLLNVENFMSKESKE